MVIYLCFRQNTGFMLWLGYMFLSPVLFSNTAIELFLSQILFHSLYTKSYIFRRITSKVIHFNLWQGRSFASRLMKIVSRVGQDTNLRLCTGPIICVGIIILTHVFYISCCARTIISINFPELLPCSLCIIIIILTHILL